jgi:MFS family permease
MPVGALGGAPLRMRVETQLGYKSIEFLGRFNITLGAISTAVGIGAALSQTIAGTIVHHFSFNAGFLFLAAIAAMAFSILYFFMPETRDKSFLNEHL